MVWFKAFASQNGYISFMEQFGMQGCPSSEKKKHKQTQNKHVAIFFRLQILKNEE